MKIEAPRSQKPLKNMRFSGSETAKNAKKIVICLALKIILKIDIEEMFIGCH